MQIETRGVGEVPALAIQAQLSRLLLQMENHPYLVATAEGSRRSV